MTIDLRMLSRKSHALWLAVLVDGSLTRFRAQKFSFFNLRWATSRGAIKSFPPALRGYISEDTGGISIQYARDLSSICHQHDTALGIFGLDCRLLYSLGIFLEQMIDAPCEKMGINQMEEQLQIANRVAAFSHPGFLDTLKTTFEMLSRESSNLSKSKDWVLKNIKDETLRSFVEEHL